MQPNQILYVFNCFSVNHRAAVWLSTDALISVEQFEQGRKVEPSQTAQIKCDIKRCIRAINQMYGSLPNHHLIKII